MLMLNDDIFQFQLWMVSVVYIAQHMTWCLVVFRQRKEVQLRGKQEHRRHWNKLLLLSVHYSGPQTLPYVRSFVYFFIFGHLYYKFTHISTEQWRLFLTGNNKLLQWVRYTAIVVLVIFISSSRQHPSYNNDFATVCRQHIAVVFLFIGFSCYLY